MLDNVCIPVNLDAFVLNQPVCESGLSRIAPITQPDYVSLRLDNSVIQHDILPPVDLHSAQPAIANPRISTAYSSPFKKLDLDNPNPPAQTTVSIDRSRLGVYLHWSIPRGYRAASSATSNAQGLKDSDNASSNPVFRLVPNRWLVVRVMKSYSPTTINVAPMEAWIIESDRLRNVEDLDGTIDLETDVTPFVSYDGNSGSTNTLNSQAEKYIGFKTPLKEWKEDPNAARVPLTIFNSSNPYFADYTIHNPNVFSMRDSFEYSDGKYLDQIVCDYMVVGWHSDISNSPLGTMGISGTLEARLRGFLCSLDDSTDTSIKTSLEKTGLISHGVIYDVSFNTAVKPVTPADDYARNFTDNIAMEPVAVGTTPLDSVLTFLKAHNKDDVEEEHLFGPGSATIANDVLSISELLYTSQDDYDSRVKAADLVFSQNFVSTGGGSTWYYDKKKESDGPPLPPSTVKDPATGKSELDYLQDLKEAQIQLDITDRALALKRWELFAQFFNFCSDAHNTVDNNLTRYVNKVNSLYNVDTTKSSTIRTLLNNKTILEGSINKITGSTPPLVQARKVANDSYFMRSDPTLTIAGIDSGWPAAFLDVLSVRLSSEIIPVVSSQITTLLTGFSLPSVAGGIIPTIAKLLTEGSDGTRRTATGFKTWNGQPFCPVFVEWEAVYYNVDFSNWSLQLASSPIDSSNHPHIRYVNSNPLFDMKKPKEDTRAISGRIMVLPTPSFALSAIVTQVLSTAGVDLPDSLATEEARKSLVQNIRKLKFISGDLTGFTDSLLTMATGSHVKPNVRQQGMEVQPLQDAVDATSKIMTREHLVQIGRESAKTPFGTVSDFTTATTYQPFKGVQHGQLALTKLTIVDKFGQAVCCPLPKPKPRVPPKIPEFLHPCLSDQLCPSVLPDNTLNTVFTSPDAPTSSGARLCPFIQITPAINQNARINARFVEKDSEPSSWKVCDDWDNPILGWIVVNYADSSLQFFTGDGIFYTSLRFGGPLGTMAAPKWAPFAEPPAGQNLVSDQLTGLVSKMLGGTPDSKAYLTSFFDMINSAIETMPFPPSEYSAYANAIVGKPLALVNAGWSLELEQPVLKAQQTLGPLPGDNNFPTEEAAMKSYKFPVKIGDSERPFDGMVCYWDTTNGTTDFDTMYTYFPAPDNAAPRTLIEPATFPTLSPYYLDPEIFNAQPGVAEAQAAQLQVKTLLIDPYTAFHLYTGILPIKSLQLPAWSLGTAMRNMTAFFTVGPVLLTHDIPKKYDVNAVLRADSWMATQNNPTASDAEYPIKLPISGGKGMWNWLQPYVDDEGKSDVPLYNALEVGPEDGRLRSDEGPYTLVEGFLQLARPLIKEG